MLARLPPEAFAVDFGEGGIEDAGAGEIGLAAHGGQLHTDRSVCVNTPERAKKAARGSLYPARKPLRRQTRASPAGSRPARRADQAVDVGVLARIEARVLAVLGVDLDALGGGRRGDGAVDLGQVVVAPPASRPGRACSRWWPPPRQHPAADRSQMRFSGTPGRALSLSANAMDESPQSG